MKKMILVVALLLVGSSAYAQGGMDAYKASELECKAAFSNTSHTWKISSLPYKVLGTEKRHFIFKSWSWNYDVRETVDNRISTQVFPEFNIQVTQQELPDNGPTKIIITTDDKTVCSKDLVMHRHFGGNADSPVIKKQIKLSCDVNETQVTVTCDQKYTHQHNTF